jgi:opacity protein-like surface antigen
MKLCLTSVARHVGVAAACVAAIGSVQAQGGSTTQGAANRYSFVPYTTQGYIGLNVGRPDWNLGCADPLGLYKCDDPSSRTDLYTGGLINEWLGAEIGYTNEGSYDRAGGRARAEGIKANLVVRVPMGAFNVFAKGGTIYGRTKVSAAALSGVPTGKDSGWGVSWGAGVGYDFTPNVGAVLEWSRNEYRFKGVGREDVDSTNLGLVYRF